MAEKESSLQWYRVDLFYACYGIRTLNGMVIEAPPIAKWMQGELLEDIVEWVLRRDGVVTKLTEST